VVLAANKLDDTKLHHGAEQGGSAHGEGGRLSANFTREFPAYSITVIKFEDKAAHEPIRSLSFGKPHYQNRNPMKAAILTISLLTGLPVILQHGWGENEYAW